MDPFQRDFYLVYALIAGAIVVFIKWGGRSKRATTLNMDHPSRKGELQPPIQPIKANMSGAPRELNVIFQFNGHDWDAYEVLGVPAGSPQPKVKEAYELSLSKVDPQSQEFIHLAYQSICLKLGWPPK